MERRKFEFGDFLLDAREQTLLRGGKTLSITPKAFQLLLVLIVNHGHLVKKDELMNAVWADSFVEEANLAFTIGLLRKTLEDDAQNPRFIETLPRRGYRFIAEVKSVETKEENNGEFELIESSAPQSNNEVFSTANFSHRINKTESRFPSVLTEEDWNIEATADKLKSADNLLEFPTDLSRKTGSEKTGAIYLSGKNKMIVSLAVVLFLFAAAVLGYYFFSQKNARLGSKKSIAVLPLKPINTANRDELYEIGIADSLILRLSSMKGLIVRPLSATRKYADIEQDAIRAGKEQQADYVLASNYQLANGKFRITSQLFNVVNGQIEETYKSEKEAGNIFAMQDVIADEVGKLLQKRLADTSNRLTANRGTTNEEAYRLYLQGMYLYDRRNLADSRKGVEVLEQAVRLDPNYAQAWARKALHHRNIANTGRNTNIQEEYQKSKEAINKALSLDENLADAYGGLCDNKMYTEYDFAGAEQACKRAIELDPNSSLSHQIYARYLNTRGRSDEAIAASKTAIDLEPTSLLNQRVYGTCLFFARRYEESVTQFKRLAATDANFSNTYNWIIPALEMQGNYAEAFEWFMKWLVLQKADQETISTFQTAFQTSGWQGVLRERIKRFEKSNETFFHGAAYNAQIGNKDQAFEYLEKSYQRRELWMANLQVDPRLDSLRDDPRFAELVRRVELK